MLQNLQQQARYLEPSGTRSSGSKGKDIPKQPFMTNPKMQELNSIYTITNQMAPKILVKPNSALKKSGGSLKQKLI